jgi:hypothetical protein
MVLVRLMAYEFYTSVQVADVTPVTVFQAPEVLTSVPSAGFYTILLAGIPTQEFNCLVAGLAVGLAVSTR